MHALYSHDMVLFSLHYGFLHKDKQQGPEYTMLHIKHNILLTGQES